MPDPWFRCASCAEEGGEHVARGLCSACYKRHREYGTLDRYQPVRDLPRPPHTCTTHAPGTPVCYREHRCRCRDCTTAKVRYDARLRLDRQRRLVPSIGARRRVQGLAWAGWPQRWLDALAGYQPGTINAAIRRDLITRRTDRKLRELTDRLAGIHPEPTTTGERIAVSRAKALARRDGWPPLMAWDEGRGPHGIDNPDATPHGVRRGNPGRTGNGETVAELEGLLAAGEAPEQIARQLGVKLDTLQQDARRRGRQDLIRRLGRAS